MSRHMDEISGGERDYKHELNQAWKENDQLRSRIEELEEQLNAVCYECYEEKQCDDCKDLTTAREIIGELDGLVDYASKFIKYGMGEAVGKFYKRHGDFHRKWGKLATQALEELTNETSHSTKKSGHKSIHQKC